MSEPTTKERPWKVVQHVNQQWMKDLYPILGALTAAIILAVPVGTLTPKAHTHLLSGSLSLADLILKEIENPLLALTTIVFLVST